MEVGSIPTGGTSFNSVADQLAVVKHEGDSQLASVSHLRCDTEGTVAVFWSADR